MGLKVKQNKTKLKWKEDVVVRREGADGNGRERVTVSQMRCTDVLHTCMKSSANFKT